MKTILFLCCSFVAYVNAMEHPRHPQTENGFYPPEDAQVRHAADSPHVIHINDPKEILPLIADRLVSGKKVLVQFDIDGTLGNVLDRRLSDPVYAANVALRRTLVPESQHIDPYAGIFEDHFQLMTSTRMVPLDSENTFAGIKRILDKHNVFSIGNTSRSVPYKRITDDHLKNDLGIDFDATLARIMRTVPTEISFKTSPPTSFYRGVIYSAALPKSETLRLAWAAFREQDTSFTEPEVLIAIDDRERHLRDIDHEFGREKETVLIHLNTQEALLPQEDHGTQERLMRTALSLTADQKHGLAERPIETLKLAGIKPFHAKAIVYGLLDQHFLHAYDSSDENLTGLINQSLGGRANRESATMYAAQRKTIVGLLHTLHTQAKKEAPLFNFVERNRAATYLATYLARTDANNHLVRDHHRKLVYDQPILIPKELVYGCNLRLIEKLRQKTFDSLHDWPPRRVFSYLDLSENPPSPPLSPTEPEVKSPATTTASRAPRFDSGTTKTTH